MKLLKFALAFISAPLLFFSNPPPPPANDSPCNPYDFGFLPVPPSCPNNSFGTAVSIQGSTIGAAADTISYALQGCFNSTGNINPSHPDVWYAFTASGEKANISLTGVGANQMLMPGISVFMDNNQTFCNNLLPIYCEISTNGSLSCTIPDLVPGEKYYVQVRGCATAATDEGDFNISIACANQCMTCAKNSFITTSPLPVLGYYPQNQYVTFMYFLKGYKSYNGNYLKAVIPNFTPGWDITNISATAVGSQPVSGHGQWKWATVGAKTGFIYDENNDGNFLNDGGDTSNNFSTWAFTFTAKTKTCSTGKNLTVDMHAMSDGEFLSGNTFCNNDPDFHYKTVLNCCSLVALSPTQTTCLDTCNATLMTIGTSTVTTPYPLTTQIEDGFGNPVGSAYSTTLIIPTHTTSNMCGGVYNIITHDASGSCYDLQNVNLTGPFQYVISQNAAVCSGLGDGAQINFSLPPNGYIFSWEDQNHQTIAGVTTPYISNQISGWYYVNMVAQTGTCPPHQDSIFLFNYPSEDPTFSYPVLLCNNHDTILPLYIASPGGSFAFTSGGPPQPSIFFANGAMLTDTSEHGTYTLQYTTPGPCPATSSVTFDIVSTYDASFNYNNQIKFCKITSDSIIPQGTAVCMGTYSAFSISGSGVLSINSVTGVVNVDQSSAGTFIVNHYISTGSTCDSYATDTLTIVDTCQTTGSGVKVSYNAITPNQDGFNDFWVIPGIDQETNNYVEIFNRYGTKVFSISNYNNVDKVWDGRGRDGKKLPPATYFYVIKLESGDTSLKGWIELME